MRNSIETIVIAAALLSGCGQVGQAKSVSETSVLQETATTVAAKPRQKLTPDTLRNIVWPAGKMTPNTTIIPDGDVNVFFPELHHQVNGNPEMEELHRDLFINIDFLLQNYDISFVGYEGISEIDTLRTMAQQEPFYGNKEAFLAYIIETQNAIQQPLPPEMVSMFRIALSTNLTMEERRTAIQPLIGKVPARYLIEIIYNESNSGVQVAKIDMDQYTEWNALDDEILNFTYEYEQELLTVTLDETDSTPAEEITLQTAFKRAKKGDEKARTAYCLAKTTYDAAKSERNATIHPRRNAHVAEKIRRRPGNSVILFGTFHTEGIHAQLPQETFAVIESTHLRSAAASFREDPKEPVTDADIFTPKRELERFDAVLPNLPKGCPKENAL